MRRLVAAICEYAPIVRRISILGLLLLAPALAVVPRAAPAAASGGFAAACAATPFLNNVPRGSELAVEWQLCAMTNGHGSWGAQLKICGAGARTASCAGQRCGQHVAARLHVELSVNGTGDAIADTREVVEPVTCEHSSFISTGWHRHGGSGWYCATLWNHDALGFYKVVPGEVSLGGDRESSARDLPGTAPALATTARVPHLKAAGKWSSVCLGW